MTQIRADVTLGLRGNHPGVSAQSAVNSFRLLLEIHASGVVPSATSKLAATSPIVDSLTGLKSTISEARALGSRSDRKMPSLSFPDAP